MEPGELKFLVKNDFTELAFWAVTEDQAEHQAYPKAGPGSWES